MSICDPTLVIICDSCDRQDEYHLTPMAAGGWDDRHLRRDSEELGWRWDDDGKHYCGECREPENE